jgi:hypothetical protein
MRLIAKYALALKCLAAAHEIDSSNPTLHVQLLRFRKALDNLSEPLAPAVAEVVNAEFDKLLPKSQNLGEWNDSFLSTHKESPLHTQAGLKCRHILQPDSKAQCEKDLVATLDLANATIETALAGLDILYEWGSDKAAKTAYVEKATSKWPESTVFQLS